MRTSKPLMVVDDDPFILEFLKSVLEAFGYSVVTASDGRDALEQLEVCGASLILLDMAMPVLDGRGFLQELRRNPELKAPVVVMTAMDDARRMARDLGTEGWLQKPFDLDALLETVSRLTR